MVTSPAGSSVPGNTPISDEAVDTAIDDWFGGPMSRDHEMRKVWRDRMRSAFAVAAPLLVSAEAERPSCPRCEGPTHTPGYWCHACRVAELEEQAKGLRAEMALREVARDEAICQRDDLRAELAALRAAGGLSEADVMKWVADNPYFGNWDEWVRIAYNKIPVLPRMALSHLYGKHADREAPFQHCVFCELFDHRAAGGQEKPTCDCIVDCGHCVPRPAPVGGQAEPSDDRCKGCGSDRWVGWAPGPDMAKRRQCVPCGRTRPFPPAAAVSGEQAQPSGERCPGIYPNPRGAPIIVRCQLVDGHKGRCGPAAGSAPGKPE